MPVVLTHEDVRKQSEAVFKQFGEKWKQTALENSRLPRKDTRELEHSGVGKFMAVCVMGESLEENAETIKKHRDKCTVFTCDKGFGPLLDHGVKADYVMVCDTNIPYRFMEKYRNETEGVPLIATPYANVVWTTMWKGPLYFYVNKDSLSTENIFKPMFGDSMRVIPASSNVSNAMIVFFNDVGENQGNWAGYERYLLVGYDYSWRPYGNYYAWDNPLPKRNYMNHRTLKDFNLDTVFTSENLLFSAKWMYSYATTYKCPVINCSGRGLLDIPMKGKLERQLTMINPDTIVRHSASALFQLLKQNFNAFKLSEQLFNKSREELIKWQSAI